MMANSPTFRAWLQLIRPPNLFTVPGDPVAGFLLVSAVGGCAPDMQQALLPALVVLFLYIGGLIGNDLADLVEDTRDRPFRPLPSGRISRAGAWAATVFCVVFGLFLALGTGHTTFLAAVLTQVAILAYNGWLKHYTWSGALAMGVCRGGSVLVGATAAGWPQSPIRIVGPALEMMPGGCVIHVVTPEFWWAKYGVVLVAALGIALYIAGVTAIADRETTSVRIGVRRWLPVTAWVGLWVMMGVWLRQVSLPGLALIAASVAWAGYQGWLLRGVPAPSAVGATVGGLIRGLLLVQAGCCAFTGQPHGLLAAIVLLVLWPVSGAVARWFYAT
ncbi:MAG: UbiA family prenyltransferase [bacterium]